MIIKEQKKSTLVLRKFIIISLFSVICTCMMTGRDVTAAKKTQLTAKNTTIYVNGSYKIKCKNKKTKSTFFYTSNNTKVAKVNGNGKITGIGKGTARIKVRYKRNGSFRTVGTFKVTVKKPTLKSSYQTQSLMVSETLTPDDYMNNKNPGAFYVIESTNKNVVSTNATGKITATKSGQTTLTIRENFGGKQRTLGTISVNVSGATMTIESLKIPFETKLPITEYLEGMNPSFTYSYESSNTDILYIEEVYISDESDETEWQVFSSIASEPTEVCTLTVYEKNGTKKRVVGKLNVTVTSEAFLLPENQTHYIGYGATLSMEGYEPIQLTNKKSTATYTFLPDDNTVLDSELKAINYGTTNVTIVETDPESGLTTIIPEKLKVTVSAPSIKQELLENGFTTMIYGDTYGDYPIICRNPDKQYYYESTNEKICTTTTGGSEQGLDYLLLSPQKIGSTLVTVYEIDTISGSRDKIGSFKVTVEKDDGATPDLDTLTATDVIRSISFTYNNKVFWGNISSEELSCVFADNDGYGMLDFGTNFLLVTEGSFNILTTKEKYKIQSLATVDGTEWIATVSLGDTEQTLIDLPITLTAGELDVASVLKNITVKLGTATFTIDNTTVFQSDDEAYQFSGENRDFEAYFTTGQFVTAGATEYDPEDKTPVTLASLTNIICSVTQNTTSTDANTAVSSISAITSTDNKTWSFSVFFNNGAQEDFTVTLTEKTDF